MDAAPFYEDVADGPAGGSASWLIAADGVRIRVGHWPLADAKGTVLMFPGRTEYVEKYARAAGEFAERGFASLAIDWRGQGIADRLAEDRGLGHVLKFQDYQLDAKAAVDHAKSLGLPEPFFLVAHSMGGAIGLRALYNDYPVKAACFSAPMWGMMISPLLRPFAWFISSSARALGQNEMVVPGQSTESYVGRTSFDENLLTTDPEFYDFLEAQLKAHPDLGLGGPSVLWLNEALLEMNALHRMDSPAVPTIALLGTDEGIVDPQRIKDRMKRWPNGKLIVLEGAKHEPLMDRTEKCSTLFDDICGHFDEHL